MGNDGKLSSLQSLRAVAFIGIFLQHAEAPVSWSALGVSIFFVMSGFLMSLNHKTDLEIIPSFRYCSSFSLIRIKKLYLLHIITMLMSIPLAIAMVAMSNQGTVGYILIIVEVLLNLFLLQTWVPYSKIGTSLNGVAWYLSVTMFLYYCFPFVRKHVSNCKKDFFTILIVIEMMQWVLCIPALLVFGNKSHVYVWFMYIFPLFRLGDFFLGACLGNLYKKTAHYSFLRGSIFEAICLLATIIVIVYGPSNVVCKAFFNQTTCFIPVALAWVYLFAQNNGILTRIICNRVLIGLGNISSYTFLIHYVVTQYIKAIIIYFHIDLSLIQRMILVIAEFILTLGLSLLYIRVHNNIKDKLKRTL